jgi:hypothetical protein
MFGRYSKLKPGTDTHGQFIMTSMQIDPLSVTQSTGYLFKIFACYVLPFDKSVVFTSHFLGNYDHIISYLNI